MLPRENRLTKKDDFENVRQNGRFITSKNFTVSFLNKKNKEESRFGFIVSKKISTRAVDRNKIKRVLREIVRKNLDLVKKGTDFVIIPKPGVLHTNHGKLEVELIKCLQEL